MTIVGFADNLRIFTNRLSYCRALGIDLSGAGAKPGPNQMAGGRARAVDNRPRRAVVMVEPLFLAARGSSIGDIKL